MNVEFKAGDRKDPVAEMLAILTRKNRDALIFSRLERQKEVIAIVRCATNFDDRLRIWVWLSGEDGAYARTEARNLKAIAETLVSGQWVHQPNATLILEGKSNG